MSHDYKDTDKEDYSSHRHSKQNEHEHHRSKKETELEGARGTTDSHHRVNANIARGMSQRHEHEKEINEIQSAITSEEKLHKMAMHARHVMEASR